MARARLFLAVALILLSRGLWGNKTPLMIAKECGFDEIISDLTDNLESLREVSALSSFKAHIGIQARLSSGRPTFDRRRGNAARS